MTGEPASSVRLTERDRYLDYLRGIAILWVVVVHVFYHKQFVPAGSVGETVKSLILFEMPLLFFVSGASLYHAHQRQPSVLSFLRRRLGRLLYPYALLAAICASLFYAREIVTGQQISGDQLLSWLLLEPWPVVPVYVGFSMWFVRVMLSVTLLHVALVRLFDSHRYRAVGLVALVAAAAAFTPFEQPRFYNAVPWRQLPQYTVVYGVFLYLGYYYASGRLFKDPIRLALTMAASACAFAALVAVGFIHQDAQLNKFPPNLGFLLFGVSWLAFWLLLRAAVCGVADRLIWLGGFLRFFGTHSYSVFLFHGFGFSAADFALPALRVTELLAGAHYVVGMAAYLACALGFTILTVAFVDTGTLVAKRALANRGLAWPRHALGANQG